MRIENIITIDFDIIMAPSIELYNALIGEGTNLQKITDSYNHLFAYCDADLDIYKRLTIYLINVFKTIEDNDIHFIRDHQQVYNYLEQNKKYNVFNIDHHHDLGYKKDYEDHLECGNWVQMMDRNGFLNNYTWISNINSSEIENNDYKKYQKVLFYNFNLSHLPKPDKLIICLSEDWIPKQFIPLFNLWLDIYNSSYSKGKSLIIEPNPQRR